MTHDQDPDKLPDQLYAVRVTLPSTATATVAVRAPDSDTAAEITREAFRIPVTIEKVSWLDPVEVEGDWTCPNPQCGCTVSLAKSECGWCGRPRPPQQ
jgi:hypothetical protein